MLVSFTTPGITLMRSITSPYERTLELSGPDWLCTVIETGGESGGAAFTISSRMACLTVLIIPASSPEVKLSRLSVIVLTGISLIKS